MAQSHLFLKRWLKAIFPRLKVKKVMFFPPLSHKAPQSPGMKPLTSRGFWKFAPNIKPQGGGSAVGLPLVVGKCHETDTIFDVVIVFCPGSLAFWLASGFCPILVILFLSKRCLSMTQSLLPEQLLTSWMANQISWAQGGWFYHGLHSVGF